MRLNRQPSDFLHAERQPHAPRPTAGKETIVVTSAITQPRARPVKRQQRQNHQIGGLKIICIQLNRRCAGSKDRLGNLELAGDIYLIVGDVHMPHCSWTPRIGDRHNDLLALRIRRRKQLAGFYFSIERSVTVDAGGGLKQIGSDQMSTNAEGIFAAERCIKLRPRLPSAAA